MTALLAFLGVRGTIVAGVLTALLLAASGVAGWQYVRAEAAIIAERTAKADARDAGADLASCVKVNESAVALERARARAAEDNARAHKAALERAREALARAEREKAVLDRAMDQWRDLWGQRSHSCAAALTALDSACPELGRY